MNLYLPLPTMFIPAFRERESTSDLRGVKKRRIHEHSVEEIRSLVSVIILILFVLFVINQTHRSSSWQRK